VAPRAMRPVVISRGRRRIGMVGIVRKWVG
jgi:hypothetical protein